MNLPPLKKKAVSIGYAGIELFDEAALKTNQIGYSVMDNGESLVGDGEGDWKASWIVIGYETNCGDPIFLDTDQSQHPVYTAMHGAGKPERDQAGPGIENLVGWSG